MTQTGTYTPAIMRRFRALSLVPQEVVIYRTFTGVYFLIRDNEVVYCGQALNVVRRIGEHAVRKVFDRALAVEVPEELLGMVEFAFSRVIRPVLNVEMPVISRLAAEWEEAFVSRHLEAWGEIAAVFVRRPAAEMLQQKRVNAVEQSLGRQRMLEGITAKDIDALLAEYGQRLLFRVREVAKFWGVEQDAIMLRAKNGALPTYKLSERSPHHMIKREDLERWAQDLRANEMVQIVS